MADEYDNLLSEINAHNEASRTWHGARLAAAEDRNDALEELQWRAVQAAYDLDDPERAAAFMQRIAERRSELNDLWVALNRQSWGDFYCD
ncbi:hypothetical protein [Streptomyces aureus]